VTFDIALVDEEMFSEGTMFDGSSIAGWKAINESDMLLMPDPTTAAVDPFFSAATLSIVCDILEPMTGEPYNRDPRGIAKKAEAYLKTTGIGDTAFFGPEAEFFVSTTCASSRSLQHRLRSRFDRTADHMDTPYEGGNLGHRSAPRAAISRFRRLIRRRTCAAKCSRPWRPWASRSKSTITKWPPRSTNSA